MVGEREVQGHQAAVFRRRCREQAGNVAADLSQLSPGTEALGAVEEEGGEGGAGTYELSASLRRLGFEFRANDEQWERLIPSK